MSAGGDTFLCPGCRRMTPLDAGRCSICGTSPPTIDASLGGQLPLPGAKKRFLDPTDPVEGMVARGLARGLRYDAIAIATAVIGLLVMAMLFSLGFRPKSSVEAPSRRSPRDDVPVSLPRLPGALTLPSGFGGPVQGKGPIPRGLGDSAAYTDAGERVLVRTHIKGAAAKRPLGELVRQIVGGAVEHCDDEAARATCVSFPDPDRRMVTCAKVTWGVVCASLDIRGDEDKTRAELVYATTSSP